MLFSIIVPVYNIKPYLSRCVDSVLAQEFCDFELVLVNDGSTDSSAEICDSYAAGDIRVRVIHKENGGLSSARNAGMARSKGQYFLFIDGDDFIERGSLAGIADALVADSFPDVMFLDAAMYYEVGGTAPYGRSFSREDFYGKPGGEVARHLASIPQFHVSACVKAVRREFLERANIRFTEGIVGEDVDYSINVYLHAATYSALKIPYYCYRQNREGSIMSRGGNTKRYSDLILIVETWASRAEGSEHRELIYRFLYHQYFILLTLYRPEFKARLRQYLYLLKYTDNPKAVVLRAVCGLFGPGMASKLIGGYR